MRQLLSSFDCSCSLSNNPNSANAERHHSLSLFVCILSYVRTVDSTSGGRHCPWWLLDCSLPLLKTANPSNAEMLRQWSFFDYIGPFSKFADFSSVEKHHRLPLSVCTDSFQDTTRVVLVLQISNVEKHYPWSSFDCIPSNSNTANSSDVEKLRQWW